MNPSPDKLSPHQQRLRQRQARELQTRQFNRNQAIGILLLATAVLIYRLLHAPSGWIFPPGWWRLW